MGLRGVLPTIFASFASKKKTLVWLACTQENITPAHHHHHGKQWSCPVPVADSNRYTVGIALTTVVVQSPYVLVLHLYVRVAHQFSDHERARITALQSGGESGRTHYCYYLYRCMLCICCAIQSSGSAAQSSPTHKALLIGFARQSILLLYVGLSLTSWWQTHVKSGHHTPDRPSNMLVCAECTNQQLTDRRGGDALMMVPLLYISGGYKIRTVIYAEHAGTSARNCFWYAQTRPEMTKKDRSRDDSRCCCAAMTPQDKKRGRRQRAVCRFDCLLLLLYWK